MAGEELGEGRVVGGAGEGGGLAFEGLEAGGLGEGAGQTCRYTCVSSSFVMIGFGIIEEFGR